jgi:hypothetical protein
MSQSNVEQMRVSADAQPTGKKIELPPPIHLEPGSIVMLRMRGHTRTAGLEYFSPGVVINQFEPHGQIEVLIWDSTAGTHYNGAYEVRELGVRGDGADREMYVVQENIQSVLFSPERFASMAELVHDFDVRLKRLEESMKSRPESLATGSTLATAAKPPVK